MFLNLCAKAGIISSAAVLLSGCSWLGLGGHNSHHANNYGGKYAAQQQYRAMPRLGPCQITSPTQRIPQGCRPEQVSLALAPVASGYNQAQYTTGGYGSHVGAAHQAQAAQMTQTRYKRPRLRGQLSLGIDHSIGGTLYDPGVSGSAAAYNRALFAEGSTTGSIASGTVTQTTYTSAAERINSPTISYDDVWTAPVELRGGVEFILSKHATVFANAGYTRAEGKKGGSAEIIDTLLKTTQVSTYNTDPANGPVGALLGTTTNTQFIPNRTVATFDYDFNELEKYDFEVGGRYYFNPIVEDSAGRPLTPFVSASAGAAHYNDTTVRENQKQLFLGRAFENNEANFYDVAQGAPTKIYDAQWVPYGTVKAGVEWQLSPKTALALETGLKYEGAREFTAGAKGDENISIPVTIRGSFNF